jgi:hypothetical protein
LARRVQLDPADTAAHVRGGWVLWFTGRPGEALPWLGTAVEQEPGDRWIHFFLGNEVTSRISTSLPSTRFVVTFVPGAAPFGGRDQRRLALGLPIPAGWRHPLRA